MAVPPGLSVLDHPFPTAAPDQPVRFPMLHTRAIGGITLNQT